MSAAIDMRDGLADLRLSLFANGYAPIPITDHNYAHPKVACPGKQPFFTGWQNLTSETITPDLIRGWSNGIRWHGNTGMLTGALVGVDIDITVPELSAEMDRLAEALLGPTPLHRVGKAPKLLRCYRAETVLKKMETPELFLPDGAKVQVEILAKGQQFIGYGIHPETKQPYRWLNGSPETIALAKLPVVSEAALRTFLAAAEAVMRRAGGRTEKELKAPAQPKPDEPLRNRTGAREETFFSRINAQALRSLSLWFPVLFPRARQEVGTGAWRISSEELGRNLEEDISFHPVDGGRDFGIGQGCSAIDVVIEWGRAPDATAAALWICEQIGVDPTSLGWKAKTERKTKPSTGTDSDQSDQPARAGTVIRVVAGELHHTATAAEAAIIEAGLPIYQRGPALVRPVSREMPASRGRTTIAAGLGDLNVHALIDVLCGVAEWERYDGRSEDWVRTNPPVQVAQILLAREGQWKLPAVAGIVTTPTLRPDGTILSEAGYDAATRLYHVADPGLALSPAVHRPTRQDAERALADLEALIAEFPFVKGEEMDGKPGHQVSKAVALSAMITPVVRGALSVAPLHAFRANTAGSGKSYLADVASAISTGRPCPVIAAATNEDETEKRIAGLLLAGFPIISVDNVNGELGGDLLAQAVERPLIRMRPLGRSDIIEIESRATVYATGNNLRVRGDMVRRTLLSDLDAGLERPELRTFTSDPVATVIADRGRYVSAALIIVRAYLAAGCPDQCAPLASFEDWSRLVRSALVWLGCPDPARSMEAAREDDPELGELREMLGLWVEAFGIGEGLTIRDVAARVEERTKSVIGEPTDLAHPELRDALLRIAGERAAISTRRLGRWMMSREGRIVGTIRFKRTGISHGSLARWAVLRV